VDASSSWLQHFATGRVYFLAAAALVVFWVLARMSLAARPGGRRLLDAVHALEGAFLALLLAAMISLSFLQILLRNLAETSFVWIDPLLRHMLLWVGFLGAMLASRIGRHINVDALSRFLSRRVLRGTRTLTHLLAACVCLLLSDACMHLVAQEAEFGRPGFLGVPLWIVQLVMPFATLGMSARFLGHALGTLRGRELAVDLNVPGARP
jgi:TRAP-type C4-dicarboxylate transport system permease small subunit